MGCNLTFRCPACKYAAHVSGGPDMGMRCETLTIHCRTCKEVLDVVTRRFEPTQGPTEDPGLKIAPKCPEGEAHDVVAWSRGGLCPKCETAMEASEDDIVLWD